MNYYEVALIKSPLKMLTYASNEDISIGKKVFVSIKNRKKNSEAVIVSKVTKPTFNCKIIEEILPYYYSDFMMKIGLFISKYYVCSIGEALSSFVPFKVNKIHEKSDMFIKKFKHIELSKYQQKAFDFCNNNNVSLLFANTSSGKTEIYIKSIQKHLTNNKQGLLLMPEISLTPQMQKRLENVFGNKVALWHSKIKKIQKQKIINGLESNSIQVVAGARSALFLPFSNLGIIIVDEEHDESYKSDLKPRYNAKDLSIYIGNNYNIQVILGSATPSISSFFKIPYTRLKEKYFYSEPNKITFDNSKLGLSPLILENINKALDKQKQIIVFVPTRANFKFQICSDCGKAVECPYCSVSMSLYRNEQILKCHYCNFSQIIPNNCPSCTMGIITNNRLGTAEVHKQLCEYFPNNQIVQFDRDKIRTDNQLRDVLNKFNDNKIDILVGTQMLSKGHDYHNVHLCVILGIDSVLNMESYKSREKALSLAIQISGRSGRKNQGEVLIQTKNLEFFDYFLIKNDYEIFLKEELKFRDHLYPPKIRLARIIFAHSNALKAKKNMNEVHNQLSKYDKINVIKYGECTIFKISNKYRYEILLRSSSIKILLQFLHSIESSIVSIDMDTLF